jgi:hypothetical protein
VTDNTTTGPLTISNTTPDTYVWDTSQVGGSVFIDRGYTYSSIPSAYVGLDVLQTANGDKCSTGESFLSFDVDQAVTVYVAYDVRIPSLPGWLQSWTDTGDEIVDTDTTRHLYRQDFAAGTVTLGGNEGCSYSMYTVFLGPQGDNGGGTGSATLSWTPPTKNEDNSPLDDLAGYKVYYGTSSGQYTKVLDVNDPNAESYVVGNLSVNTTYYFAVTAYDLSSNESKKSNEAWKLVN